ncbi:GAF domain-containing sensor histidine kinase [Spirulina subsalsa FACHB-351]|uniref:histidine kinase n=1 Tax=Spirulina subsalsa FACHB-351 TaxID=234711 RepID=A0ABT3L8Y6_9CYAN|nr:GAF domain-containing sensor histidine kinase [Spirulina subsalsa]MCW6037972.1 GAF domain-containing sensor histidine kinase [Spirulina subsalsa FACHB-351]
MSVNNRLFCRLDGLTSNTREQQRLERLSQLGLLTSDLVPVFDEATQTVARFLATPISTLNLLVEDQLWLKSTVGLSHVGLMSDLANSRRLPLIESFCQYIIDTQQPLVIENVAQDALFSRSILFQHYGIHAYVGVPLITQERECIGTLTVMDLHPRSFSPQEIEFLNLTARWCISEYERSQLLPLSPPQARDSLTEPTQGSAGWTSPNYSSDVLVIEEGKKPEAPSLALNTVDTLKVKLLATLTEELRNPLTSIMGMARVLEQGVYGSLTPKQREYIEIIYRSGQNLLALVEEILGLEVLDQKNRQLQLSAVDIEMICQQAISNLQSFIELQQQQIHLTVEPGNRIWLLDKEKVKQGIYYLIFSLLSAAQPGSQIDVHVSRHTGKTLSSPHLQIALWTSNPWLNPEHLEEQNTEGCTASQELTSASLLTHHSVPLLKGTITPEDQPQEIDLASREGLGLLLCCSLIELHGGSITVQGTPELGYRYLLKLPQLEQKTPN